MNKLFSSILAVAALAVPAGASAQAVVAGSDFEAEAFPPAGWTTLDRDNDGHGWLRYAGSDSYVTQTSGSTACAVSFSRDHKTYSSFGAQDNWLISPAVTVANAQTILSFVYSAQDTEQSETIEVLVSETGTDPESFTQLYKTTFDNGYDGDILVNSLERSLAAYEGKTIYLAVRHQVSGTYGLSIDNFFVLDKFGPKAPTGLKVAPGDKGALEAVVTWTTPSKTATGDDLADVEIVIFRDGEQVAVVSGTPGQEQSYTDAGITAGRHTYAVAARNSAGQTRPTAARAVQVGPDVPKAVGNPMAMVSGSAIVLTWTAPTAGASGGFFDPADVHYIITRVVDGQASVIASDVTATTYTDEAPVPGKSMIYTVQAANAAGTSAIADYTAATYVEGDVFAVGITAERDNSLERIPVAVNSNYGVSQSIYYPADFQYAKGTIKSLIYKGYKGTDTDLEFPVRIYMHETQTSDLEAGWDKGVSESDKVFEGNITYLQGARDYLITLTSPYEYKGGNLVVTFIKDGKPSGAYSDRFYSVTTDRPNRTYTGSVYDPVDITALPTLGSYSAKKLSEIPSTRFVIDTKGVTSLSGKVTNAATGAPVPGAVVAAPAYGIEAVTDEAGTYAVPYVPVDVTALAVSRTGYESQSVPVTLTDGTPAVADVSLTQLAFVTLSGTAKAADTGLPAAGAVVSLSGYDEISAVADSEGRWSLSPVYSGSDYTLSVAYPLYDIHTAPVNITADTHLPEIELQRSLIAPFAVSTEVAPDGSAVALTWSDPLARDCAAGWNNMSKNGDTAVTGTVGDKWYSPDDFNVAHAFTAATVAGRRLAGTVVSEMKVYIKATEGTFTAKVWKGTRSDNTVLAAQEIPASEISADGAWVTVRFDTPAEIREGNDYLVGLQCVKASSEPVGEVKDCVSDANNIKWADSGAIYSNGYDGFAIDVNFTVPGTSLEIVDNPAAPRCEYAVYRRSAADTGWTRVSAAPVKETSFSDAGWASLLSGEYTYGVTALYRGSESAPALSLPVSRGNDIDAGVSAFVTPVKRVEMQTSAEVKVTVTNYGEKPAADIPVVVSLNGVKAAEATCSVTLNKGESTDVVVGTIELPEGVHTLVASTALAGDLVAANDACELVLPNMANICLSGYRWSAYGNAGFMQIESNNAEAALFRREVTPNDALLTAGEYFDGNVYAYTATWYGEPREFVSVKHDVWTLESHLENKDDYCIDLAYDYKNGIMYGLRADGESLSLATVDLATGAATPVASVAGDARVLACDTEGTLYTVDGTGNFCTIDPVTGALTEVGHTGVTGTVKYLQSMAFDHNTGRLFWVHVGSHTDGTLTEIDPATGKASELGDVLFDGTEPSEIVALHTPYTHSGISSAAADAQALTVFAEPDGVIAVSAPAEAALTAYNTAGEAVTTVALPAGSSRVKLPVAPGFYLLRAVSGTASATAKTIIR